MIVLHVANLTDEKSKGPNINVPKNIIYGSKYADVALYNLQDSKLAMDLPRDKVFSIKNYKSIDKLPEPFNTPEIVVFQGVYYIQYCKIATKLRKLKIPYVIVPRCSLTKAAIKSHYLKKTIANKLFFNKFISNARAVQFLTKNEYLESKDNFKFKDYFVLGNGFETPKKHYSVKNRKEFKVVFIGRYNIYHKGLDVLLESVNNNKDWFIENNVLLELYGSDSDNGLTYLSSYVRDNGLKEIIRVNGPVFDRKKEEALLDADIFIHTSRLEGQPTSVIEAISYGVPVIVTPGTNVADIVKENNLGFTTKLEADKIFQSIKKSFSEKNNFSVISKNEANYAKKRFSWEEIAKEFSKRIV